jgi:hypothetical protein
MWSPSIFPLAHPFISKWSGINLRHQAKTSLAHYPFKDTVRAERTDGSRALPAWGTHRHRFEAPLCLEDPVRSPGVAGRDRMTVTANSPGSGSGTGNHDGPRQHPPQSYPPAGECTDLLVAREDGTIAQGSEFAPVAAGISRIAAAVLGTALVGSGLFLCDGWSRHRGTSETV